MRCALGPVRLAVAVTWVAIAAGGLGCLTADIRQCADGTVCPGDRVCHPAGGDCLFPDQLASCEGLDNSDTCNIAGSPVGICRGGICIAPGCGNGFVELGEECEPGGAADCVDFGFYVGGAVSCTTECVFETSTCSERCGDNVINGLEICDGEEPGESCLDFGFDEGMTGCALCGWGFDACADIGFVRESSIAAGPLWVSPAGVPHVARHDGFARGTEGGSWQHVDGLPAGLVVVGISGFDEDNILVLAKKDAEIYLYDGVAFSLLHSNPGESATAIWAGPGGEVVVIGNTGFLVHFDGQAWSKPSLNINDDLLAIDAAGADKIWIAGAGLRTAHYNGAVWTSMKVTEATGFNLTDVAVDPDGTAYLAGEIALDGETLGVLLYVGPGGEWLPVPKSMQRDARFTAVFRDDDELFVGTRSGRVLRFTSSGWHDVHGGAGEPVLDIVGRDATRMWARVGNVLLRNDGRSWGTTWFDGNVRAVLSLDDGERLALTSTESGMELYRSYGDDWSLIHSSLNAGGGDLWARSPTEVYLATPAGAFVYDGDTVTGFGPGAPFDAVHGTAELIFLVRPGSPIVEVFDGLQWTTETPLAGPVEAIWAVANDDVYAVGLAAQIAHRVGQDDWQLEVPPTSVPLRAVWVAPDGTAFAAGHDGTILKKVDSTWGVEDSPAIEDLLSIGGSSSTDVWVGGVAGALYHYDGVRWNPVNPADYGSRIESISVDDGRPMMGGSNAPATGGRVLDLLTATQDP